MRVHVWCVCLHCVCACLYIHVVCVSVCVPIPEAVSLESTCEQCLFVWLPDKRFSFLSDFEYRLYFSILTQGFLLVILLGSLLVLSLLFQSSIAQVIHSKLLPGTPYSPSHTSDQQNTALVIHSRPPQLQPLSH